LHCTKKEVARLKGWGQEGTQETADCQVVLKIQVSWRSKSESECHKNGAGGWWRGRKEPISLRNTWWQITGHAFHNNSKYTKGREQEKQKTIIMIKLTVSFVRVSIAVKSHRDQGNSYKGKHLIGIGLQFQRLSSLSPW